MDPTPVAGPSPAGTTAQTGAPAATGPVPYTTEFAAVLQYELQQVAARRQAVIGHTSDPPAIPNPGVEAVRTAAHRMDLFGLAFSGGGIRSGTFNLGILQSLASLELLSRVDYLSTVSGGGYIGGWLAAWVRREADAQAQRAGAAVAATGPANAPATPPLAATAAGMANTQAQMNPSRLAEATAVRPPVEENGVRDEEPEPVRHLRSYSRYLTPRPGLMSLDAWAVIGIYARNVFVNQMLLLPLAVAAVLTLRLLLIPFCRAAGEPPSWLVWTDSGVVVAALFVAYLLYYLQLLRVRLQATDTTGRVTELRRRYRFATLAALLLASYLGVYLFRTSDPSAAPKPQSLIGKAFEAQRSENRAIIPTSMSGRTMTSEPLESGIPADLMRSILLFGGIGLAAAFCARLVGGGADAGGPPDMLPVSVEREGLWTATKLTIIGGVFGATFGALFWAALEVLVTGGTPDPVKALTLGPPLVVLAVWVAGYADVALSGPLLNEYEREWRSRMGAFLAMWATMWAVTCGIVFYLPQFLLGGQIAAAAVWIVAAIGSYLGRRAAVDKAAGTGGFAIPDSVVRFALAAGPVIVLAGLLAGISLLVHQLPLVEGEQSGPLSELTAERFIHKLKSQSPIRVAAYLAGAAFLALWAALGVRANMFSLHALYRNRLIRCYLGASRRNKLWDGPPAADQIPDQLSGAPTGAIPPPRAPNRFTDFDPYDDLPLAHLRVAGNTRQVPDKQVQTRKHSAGPYPGPYPLFNTTLNLVAGGDLATQDRKGESFVLTPDYCGNPRVGYARLADEHVGGDNLTIGRAVAVSGAAVDPNMRNYQSPALTALLTVLNLRLGWWIENPNPTAARREVGEPWQARFPTSGGLILQELLGRTNAAGPYLHLSDGGHFENTGAYELIRRRCRYVVVIDAAEDPLDASENLANLIRLVRIDFGIRVEVDTAPLHKDDAGLSRSHVAVGVIRYDDVDAEGVNGTLVFVRASLTGDEPADLRNYAANNPPFPHHGTADQFFDENQFESYRALGDHIGRDVFAQAAAEVEPLRAAEADHRRRFNRVLFSELRRRWVQVTTAQYEQYTLALEPWTAWEDAMRLDPRLERLNIDLYPELAAGAGAPAGAIEATAGEPTGGDRTRAAEMRAMSQLVGIMEGAWMRLNLSVTHAGCRTGFVIRQRFAGRRANRVERRGAWRAVRRRSARRHALAAPLPPRPRSRTSRCP